MFFNNRMPNRDKKYNWHSRDFHVVFKIKDPYGFAGLFICPRDSKRSTDLYFHLSSASELFPNGYLKKLSKLVTNAMKYYNPRSEQSQRNNFSFEYRRDGECGQTIRAIIDAKDLSDLTKFAAIVSLLSIKEDFSTAFIMDIVRNQTRPEDIKNMPYWRNQWFLYPDFSLKKMPTEDIRDLVGYSGHNYVNYLYKADFICNSLPNETVAQYKIRTGEYVFKPLQEGRNYLLKKLHRPVFNAFETSGREIDGSIDDLIAEDVARFHKSFSLTTPHSRSFVIERMKSGLMAIEDERWMERPNSNLMANIAHFLNFEEMTELTEHFLKIDKFHIHWLNYARMSAAPIIAKIYLEGGASVVEKMIEAMENDDFYSDFRNSIKSYFIGSDGRSIDYQSILKILDNEYRDMPIDWALSLISSEASSREASSQAMM